MLYAVFGILCLIALHALIKQSRKNNKGEVKEKFDELDSLKERTEVLDIEEEIVKTKVYLNGREKKLKKQKDNLNNGD